MYFVHIPVKKRLEQSKKERAYVIYKAHSGVGLEFRVVAWDPRVLSSIPLPLN